METGKKFQTVESIIVATFLDVFLNIFTEFRK